MKSSHAWTVLLALLTVLYDVTDAAVSKPNVLFLVADDMRPELGCYYGDDFPTPVHPKMVTPSLDSLAGRSLLLKQAYVQQAVCSPSRTSLLTGRRPDTTHVYDLVKYWRNVGGNFTTIPQYFKQHGYHSAGIGKIFHPGVASGNDDPMSWSEPYYHANESSRNYYWTNEYSWRAINKTVRDVHGPLPSEFIKQRALDTLTRLAPKAKSGEQPFFLAVGFHKPHLPFVFPEELLEKYPMEDIKLPPNPYAPVDMPSIAWSDYGELRKYKDIHALNATGAINTTLPDDVVKKLRRAYYSALTYTDSLIGEILQTLESLGLDEHTIISFWGDHGWQLGEHGEWCKHTNFELATHAPMMVHVPGITETGIVTEKLTEFVDLFPTLVEAAGLPALPLCPENSTLVPVCTEGKSLIELMKDPSGKEWKNASFSQYPREGDVMGYTMRTEQYRYTEWVGFTYKPKYKPIWTKLHGVELYDHKEDPAENWNVAKDTSYKEVCATLSHQLRAGWRHSMHRGVMNTQGKGRTPQINYNRL